MRLYEFEKISELKTKNWGDRINEILNNPKFKSWFRGSKVIHSNGTPMIMYHYTKHKDPSYIVDDFLPLSHFGTTEQAEDIANLHTDNWAADMNNFGSTIPVFLNIKNPIRMEDLGEHEKLKYWQEEFDRLKLGSEEEITNLNPRHSAKRRRPYNGPDPTWIIPPYLKSHGGYDGVVYKNVGEGPGDSWIITHPNQVLSIFDI